MENREFSFDDMVFEISIQSIDNVINMYIEYIKDCVEREDSEDECMERMLEFYNFDMECLIRKIDNYRKEYLYNLIEEFYEKKRIEQRQKLYDYVKTKIKKKLDTMLDDLEKEVEKCLNEKMKAYDCALEIAIKFENIKKELIREEEITREMTEKYGVDPIFFYTEFSILWATYKIVFLQLIYDFVKYKYHLNHISNLKKS